MQNGSRPPCLKIGTSFKLFRQQKGFVVTWSGTRILQFFKQHRCRKRNLHLDAANPCVGTFNYFKIEWGISGFMFCECRKSHFC